MKQFIQTHKKEITHYTLMVLLFLLALYAMDNPKITLVCEDTSAFNPTYCMEEYNALFSEFCLVRDTRFASNYTLLQESVLP